MATFKDFYNEELKKETLDNINERIEGLDDFYNQANKLHNEIGKLQKTLSKADLLPNDKDKIQKLIKQYRKFYDSWLDFVHLVNSL
jgi:hypothetical protein